MTISMAVILLAAVCQLFTQNTYYHQLNLRHDIKMCWEATEITSPLTPAVLGMALWYYIRTFVWCVHQWYFIIIMSLKTCLHIITLLIILRFCLQCFDAVGWAAGRASGLLKTEWWGAGVVICLERGADLHTAQLMQLPLTVTCFSEIQTGFTFLVPAHPGSHGQSKTLKHPLNGCLCVLYYWR